MADIIKLRGSPHEQAEQLLPWYVNGTLAPEEAAMVEAHLADCAECRAALETERKLAAEVAALPLDAEHGWALLSERMATAEPPQRLAEPVPFLRRKVAIGWAVGTPVAAAAAVAFAMTAMSTQPQLASTGQTYRALGSAPVAQSGNALIMFRPEAKDADVRAALITAQARVVDGPTASGAWVVNIAPDRRAAALAGLRSAPAVVLAEPIDPGTRQ